MVGFKQQPCPEEANSRVLSAPAWYSILFKGLKEDEEEVETKEFSDRKDADAWWNEVYTKVGKKSGRGALYINTKDNKVIKKIGYHESTDQLQKDAEEKGLYVNVIGEKKEIEIASVLPMLYKVLPERMELCMVIFMLVLMIFADAVNLECVRTTGELVSFLSGNSTQLKQTFHVEFICKNILNCETGDKYLYGVSLMLSLIFMIIFERIVDFCGTMLQYRTRTKFEEPLKNNLNEKALSLDQEYHDNHSYFDIKSRCDPSSVSTLIVSDVPNIIQAVVHLITISLYLFQIRPVLALSVFIFTVVTEQFVFLPMMKQYFKVWYRQGIITEMAIDLEYEAYNLISTVKQYSTEQFHIGNHRIAANKSLTNEKKLLIEDLKNDLIFKLFDNFLIMGAIFYEMSMSDSHTGTGDFMTLYLFIGQFSGMFTQLAGRFKSIRRSLVNVERYGKFMETSAKVVTGIESVGRSSFAGDIKIENVHFSYPSRPGEKIFKGLDITLNHSKMTAIVGESGGGKSTLAKLLMRQYDPSEGKITLDGRDIRVMDLVELHSKMGIVSQNSELMDATLSENIAYDKGTSDPSIMEQVKEAATLAQCDKFIEKFRSGLETHAGAKGLNLSGGQTQRLTVARAAMRKPDILILDEATSSLDAETESEIQNSLIQLMKGKTTIVIAHRLSTIRHADIIHCMKDGKFVESGTHEELIKLRGYYFDLISKQMIMEVKDDMDDTSDLGNITEKMCEVSQLLKGRVKLENDEGASEDIDEVNDEADEDMQGSKNAMAVNDKNSDKDKYVSKTNDEADGPDKDVTETNDRVDVADKDRIQNNDRDDGTDEPSSEGEEAHLGTEQEDSNSHDTREQNGIIEQSGG